MGITDPTYDAKEINKNPIWKQAFKLSEKENDSAPIGWAEYIPRAKVDNAWMQGFACAAGIVGYCDGESDAQEIMKQGGFSKQDLIDSGCEEVDIERIFGETKKPVKRKAGKS